MQNRSRIIIFGISILVCGLLYVFVFHGSSSQLGTETAATTTPSGRIPPRGFREYRSETYHFSLFYAEDLTVKEYKEKGTALTVVFQNEREQKGFQVYAVPYGGQDIPESRILIDAPSADINAVQNATLGGKPALTFISAGTPLGDLRELWSIHHGFLVEVTAPKELDPWLSSIMESWEFL